MKKIAKLVSNCNECQYCSEFKSKKDNYTSVYCCVYETPDEGILKTAFLLALSTSSGKMNIDIPKECPLEDYEEPKTEC
jgi:hypothetical protein